MSGVDTGSWWDDNVAEKIEEFEGWVGDADAITKRWMHTYVFRKRPKSLLDVGAGLCTDWQVYSNMGVALTYQAIDTSEVLVAKGKEAGIPIDHGDIKSIPFGDSSFEFVYARHVLEHLGDYRQAIQEMVRVASRKTIIVWFLPPSPSETRRRSPDGLMHNQYMISEVEGFLETLPGSPAWRWEWIVHNNDGMLDERALVIMQERGRDPDGHND